MRDLAVDFSRDPLHSEVLLALQFCAGSEPLLPKLIKLSCMNTTENFIPFIPLFLSPRTTSIQIGFINDPSPVTTAVTITKLPTLCPYIRDLILSPLPRSPAITAAVSETLLARNRDALQMFLADSPLTGRAYGFLCKLPKLRRLTLIIQGPTHLPRVELPDLEQISIRWYSERDWLKGFRGAAIGKLRSIDFCPAPDSSPLSGFFEEFQSIALSTSLQTSLSELRVQTIQSWTPNYSALFGFNRMTELEIQFSCRGGCSSTVDDDTIINLAQAMPGLKILRLGKQPCRTVTGVTFKGLVVLASRCLQLFRLRIHFQANSLLQAASRIDLPSLSEPVTVTPRRNCALTNLQVGEIPFAEAASSTLYLVLLQIFPEILSIDYTNPRWKEVTDILEVSRRVKNNVDYTSKAPLLYLKCSLVTSTRKNLCRESAGKRTGMRVLAVFSYPRRK